MKDRAAIGIIRRAEQEGKLKPGGTIVEATAGNTGIGLALIGVNRGYKVKLFVPERFSEEKVKIMRALGAEVTRTPDAEGMQGAIRQAKELVASDPTAFMAGQFENPANPDYHYETTAREIFEQMDGRVDAVVIGLRNVWNVFRSRAISEGKIAGRARVCRRNAGIDSWRRTAGTAQSRRHWSEFHPEDIRSLGLRRSDDGDGRRSIRHGERHWRRRKACWPDRAVERRSSRR